MGETDTVNCGVLEAKVKEVLGLSSADEIKSIDTKTASGLEIHRGIQSLFFFFQSCDFFPLLILVLIMFVNIYKGVFPGNILPFQAQFLWHPPLNCKILEDLYYYIMNLFFKIFW